METKEIITAAFSAKDRKKLWIPASVSEREDVTAQKVISWVHKSGHLGYAALNLDGHFSGITLSCSPLTAQTKACMCDWCFSVYHASKISSFTLRKTPTLTVGYFLCSALNCLDRITSPDTNGVHNMRETLSKEDRIARYYNNVEKYWWDHVL